MRFTPDFSEEFTPLLEGIYLCEILGVEAKTSNAGNRYLNWKLKTPSNQTVYYVTVIEGRASGMLKHFIRCTIAPHYEEGEIETDDFIGKKVAMSLGIKEVEYKGRLTKMFEVKEVLKDLKEQDLPF